MNRNAAVAPEVGDMLWPLVSIAGFALVTALVVVLARSGTARWERQRTAERTADQARQRARLARAALIAPPSSRVPAWHRRRTPAWHGRRRTAAGGGSGRAVDGG